MLLVIFSLAVLDLLPFYVDVRSRLWDQLVDYEFPYDTPIGVEAAILVGVPDHDQSRGNHRVRLVIGPGR